MLVTLLSEKVWENELKENLDSCIDDIGFLTQEVKSELKSSFNTICLTLKEKVKSFSDILMLEVDYEERLLKIVYTEGSLPFKVEISNAKDLSEKVKSISFTLFDENDLYELFLDVFCSTGGYLSKRVMEGLHPKKLFDRLEVDDSTALDYLNKILARDGESSEINGNLSSYYSDNIPSIELPDYNKYLQFNAIKSIGEYLINFMESRGKERIAPGVIVNEIDKLYKRVSDAFNDQLKESKSDMSLDTLFNGGTSLDKLVSNKLCYDYKIIYRDAMIVALGVYKEKFNTSTRPTLSSGKKIISETVDTFRNGL